jgi:hypothetical protein
MHVSLAANRLIAQPSLLIGDNTEKQHTLAERLDMFFSAYIHGNAIDRIRTVGGRGEQAVANRIQAAQLRARAEDIRTIFKCEWPRAEVKIELWIKGHIEA